MFCKELVNIVPPPPAIALLQALRSALRNQRTANRIRKRLHSIFSSKRLSIHVCKSHNSQGDVTTWSTLGSRIIRLLLYLVAKIRVVLQTKWINSFRNENMHVRDYKVRNTRNKYTQHVPETSSRLSSHLPPPISGLYGRWPQSTYRALNDPRPHHCY
jgi:hypothetical protein